MHQFDSDTCPVHGSDGKLTLDISDKWSINSTPNGGYIMALMTRAMEPEIENHIVKNPGACIVTANYLARCACEPAVILVETMGESRHFIRRQARLIQKDTEKIRAMATFLKPAETQLSSRHESEPEPVAPWEECAPIPPMEGYTLFDQVEMRLDPACTGWVKNQLSRRSVMKGWIGFKQSRCIDPPAVTLFADCFPPPVFTSQGMAPWIPTIEYSVNIRQMPATPRLKCIFTTRFISSGLLEEDGEIWDEKDNLVALSRQIAKYHPCNA